MGKRVVARKWSHLMIAYGVIALVCLVIYYLEDSRPLIKNVSLGIAIGAPTLFIVMFALIALHEGGHFLAARIVGMNVDGFCVGPFRWLKVNQDWRFSWYDDTRISGFVLASQVTGDFDRRKYLAMFAGGPLGSLVGVGFSLWFLFAFSQYREVGIGLLGLATIFMFSLVPMRAGGMGSDGHWILRLCLKPDQAAKELAASLLASLVRADVPSREWPIDVVRSLRETQGNTLEAIVARIYEFSFALEMEDDDLARKAISEMETSYATAEFADPTGTMRAIVLLDIALAKAVLDHDALRAREIVRKVENVPEQAEFVKHQVMAIVYALEGDETASRSAADDAIAELDKHAAQRPRVFQEAKDRLEKMLASARQAKESGLVPSPAIPPPLHPSPPPSC